MRLVPSFREASDDLAAFIRACQTEFACYGRVGWLERDDGTPIRRLTPEELAAIDAGAATLQLSAIPLEDFVEEVPSPEPVATDWLGFQQDIMADFPLRMREPAQEEPYTAREDSRGQYLCETCFDAMTDRVLSADQSGTGMAMAQCVACAGEGKS